MKKLIAFLLTLILCASTAALAEGAEPVRVGTLKGPTTIGLVELMDRADKGESAQPYAFTMDTADTFVTQIAKGEIDIVTIPANVAAVWYNKLSGAVRVIDVNTLGVLYLVSAGDGVESIADLAGKTVAATGKGTTPEWVLTSLLQAAGVDDAQIEYKAEPAEVVQLLVSGAAQVGMLPQPFVTAACAQNESLRVAVDLSAAWDALHPESRLCTGVTVVRTAFMEQNPDAVATFLAEHAQSAAFANEHTAEAAQLVAAAGIIEKAPVAEKAIPFCNIVCLTGDEMRAALGGYLEALYALDPASVGGQLPGEDFYVTVD